MEERRRFLSSKHHDEMQLHSSSAQQEESINGLGQNEKTKMYFLKNAHKSCSFSITGSTCNSSIASKARKF
jgi:hypothetical protein